MPALKRLHGWLTEDWQIGIDRSTALDFSTLGLCSYGCQWRLRIDGRGDGDGRRATTNVRERSEGRERREGRRERQRKIKHSE